MRARLLTVWESFRASFWFVPSWFLLAAIVAAILLPWLEYLAADWLDGRLAWIAISRESAESTLGMIATSMFTVTGVVFSMTVVSLSVVASQFGSRVVRALMVDRATQATIGLFLGTATYCFVLLRSISLAPDSQFVPYCAVAAAVLLTLAAMAALIHYIHHVAVGIQAPTVIDRLAAELTAAIDEVYSEEATSDRSREDRVDFHHDEEMVWTVEAELFDSWTDGYLQAVDLQALIALAAEYGVCLRMRQQVGEFVVRGEAIAEVRPPGKRDDRFERLARRAIVFGPRRTSWQDVSFAARELVEMALRALSPGINDPFTAVTCLDQLGAAFRRLATRRIPDNHRYDSQGELRLVYVVPELEQLLENCLSPIRQFGNEHLSVMLASFAAIAAVRQRATRSKDLAACHAQAERTWAACQHGLWQPTDLERCQAAYRELTAG